MNKTREEKMAELQRKTSTATDREKALEAELAKSKKETADFKAEAEKWKREAQKGQM